MPMTTIAGCLLPQAPSQNGELRVDKASGPSRHESLWTAAGRSLPWLAAALAIGVRLAAGSFPVDDAYITFRYARNLADGLGMIYNPGELVFGTSTLPFTVYLGSLGRALGVEALPTYALITSAMADGAAVLLLGLLCRRLPLNPGWLALTVLLQAMAPLSIRYSGSGLETSVATALFIAAVSAYLARRDILAANLAGAAAALRPDGIAVAGLLVALLTYERKRIPWKSIAILAAWILPSAILLASLYGSPLPNSVTAKSATIYHADPWTNALQFIYHFGGLFVGGPRGLSARGIIIPLVGRLTLVLSLTTVPQLLLWIWGGYELFTRDRRWLAFLALPLVFVVAYSLLGLRGSIMAEWYLPPLIPFYLLPILIGLRAALLRFTPHAFRPAAVTLAILLVVCEILGLNLGRNPSRPFLTPLSVWDERERLYRDTALFLEPLLGPGSVVAASEIGALGYYCDCRILDTVGLVSPQALAYYPLPPEDTPALNAIPEGLIQDQRPEFVVSLEVFVRETLLDDPWFLDHYDQIWRRETDAFGSDGLLVFRRRNGPSLP